MCGLGLSPTSFRSLQTGHQGQLLAFQLIDSPMRTRSLDDRITVTPGVRSGKPRIAGRRITVSDVAIWHERLGMSADEIADSYDLELADIHAALAYYFTHRALIDESIREAQAFADALERSRKSPLAQKLEGAA